MSATAGGKFCAFDLERLRELGSKSKFDMSKIRKSTLISMCSHLNLLKRNNVKLSAKLVETADLNKILDSLVTRRQEKLTPQYKIQIASTLKRLYGGKNMQLDMQPYLEKIKRTPVRVENFDYMHSLSKLINYSAEILMKFESQELNVSVDLAMYDAAVATVLTSCTSRRIAELHQLTMTDLNLIQQNRPIFIHIKGRKSNTTRCEIVPNAVVLACIDNVKRNREAVERAARADHHDNRHPNYKQGRIDNGYVFLTSISHLRNRLKQSAVTFGVNIQNLGFNRFRKYITTILVGAGGHAIAQFINAHADVSTTVTNYDTGTKIAVDRALDSITSAGSVVAADDGDRSSSSSIERLAAVSDNGDGGQSNVGVSLAQFLDDMPENLLNDTDDADNFIITNEI